MRLVFKTKLKRPKPSVSLIEQRLKQGWAEWDAHNIPKGIHRATFWYIQYKHALEKIEELEAAK